MKIVIVLIALCTVPAVTLAVGDAPGTKPPQVEVQKVEDGGSLKGLLDQVWARLRTYGPSISANDRREKNATLVAGVRGTEATSSALNPYWKGDKTKDSVYVEEVNTYIKAQGFADTGDLKQAVSAFDSFLKSYPASNLKPNAVFALGLAYAGLGDKAKGAAFLQEFVKDYPDHPLAADAGRLIGEIRKI
jgi:TolA-binding protein